MKLKNRSKRYLAYKLTCDFVNTSNTQTARALRAFRRALRSYIPFEAESKRDYWYKKTITGRKQ